MFETKSVEKIKIHILDLINVFANCAVYDIMWSDIVQPGRPQKTIWRMRNSYWIPKATNTHSEYVTFIAFPLQQCLHDRTSLLRYTYTTFLYRLHLQQCVHYIVV
jgi:hypothetical protein